MGTFEPFYESAWSLRAPDEERRWRAIESDGTVTREEAWRRHEVECREWLREHPGAAGTEIVVAYQDSCAARSAG